MLRFLNLFYFLTHAAVMGTIHDYPGADTTSRWSTKGKMACLHCQIDTSSFRLQHGGKECYMGHRRFLCSNHPWRRRKRAFDGTVENRAPPKPLTGNEIVEYYKDESFRHFKFGKTPEKRKRRKTLKILYNWKKKSIFFQLPYWETLLLRHNLDGMHIEKNVCVSSLGTFLDKEGKTKDSLKARLDLKELGIREELHPRKVGDKYEYNVACYTLSKDEKILLAKFLEEVKMPDGYASNIRRCIKDNEININGFKAHDCHVIFQQLLPLALRDLFPEQVARPFIELSQFFVKICEKQLRIEGLDELSHQIVIILCKLEQILPPAFFDIMVHLPIHLAYEAKLGGPLLYRWMYMVEHFLRMLKGYVWNKARAEGSMAEGYLLEEGMELCAHFLKNIDTKLNRPQRHANVPRTEPPFEMGLFGSIEENKKGTLITLSPEELTQTHHYVLTNCDEISPWIEQHKQELRRTSSRNIEKRHKEEFGKWFKKQISVLQANYVGPKTEHMISSIGPDTRVRSCSRYLINGVLFRTKEAEQNLTTQNSGVVVSSATDSGSIDWYGVIKKILVLEYSDKREVIMFKCDWFEKQPQGVRSSTSYIVDDYGYVNIDASRFYYEDDPYILGNQAKQFFYVKTIKRPDWCTVVRTTPRNLYAMPPRGEAGNQDRDGGGDDTGTRGTFNLCREDIERVSIVSDEIVNVDRHSSSESESDVDSNGLLYSDDDLVEGEVGN